MGQLGAMFHFFAGFFYLGRMEQGGKDFPWGFREGEGPHACSGLRSLTTGMRFWAASGLGIAKSPEHFLLPKGANAAIELFCLACSSPQVGFLRFLDLLATFDWKNNPLIVNLNAGLTGEQAACRRVVA